MNLHHNEAIKYISELIKLDRIGSENIDGKKYFKANINNDS